MAYQLVAEVLDHAPAELTASERLVLVALAERMPRRTEWDWKSNHLMRRTGLDARGLRAAVQRLAKRGIDIRVPIGKDRKGNPLYAIPGQVPRWRLPELPAPDCCTCESCMQQRTEGGTTVPPTNGGGTTVPAGGTKTSSGGTTVPAGGTTVPAAGTTVPPKPSVPQDGDGVGAGGAAASNASPPSAHEEHNPHWRTQPAYGTPRDPADAERAQRRAAEARAAIRKPDRPARRDALAALIAATDLRDDGHDG